MSRCNIEGSIVVRKKCMLCKRMFSRRVMVGYERYQLFCGGCRQASDDPNYRLRFK